MDTNIAKMKCKSSSQIIPDDKRKNLKFLIPAIATKGFKTMNSTAEEKSCLKRCVTKIKINREHMDVENAIGQGNNGYTRRETGPANQIDDKSLSKQFTRINKSTCAKMEQKDHESCLAPMRKAAYDSRDELLPGKIVEDRQVIKEEMMDILNHEAAQNEESSEENKKMRISKKQFTRIDKSTCAKIEQKDHGSCLVPMHIAAYDSRDKLLPGKIVEDRQVIKEEMMDIFNHEAAQNEESSEENKKMKISKKILKAKKAELKQLKQETPMLSQELQRISTMCMHLVDENKLLMDELKKICDPRVIEILEAKDPAGKDPQTD